MTLHTQFMTMGAMVIGGMYIGFINETFRRLTPLWNRSSLLTYSFEILFWLTQTWLLYYFLYTINNGEVRFYLFIALLFGFSIYMALFQTIYVHMLNFMMMIIKKVLIIIYKLCIMPLIYLGNFLIKLLTYTLSILMKSMKLFAYYIIFSPLKWLLPEKIIKFISKMVSFCSTMIGKLINKWRSFLKK